VICMSSSLQDKGWVPRFSYPASTKELIEQHGLTKTGTADNIW
jgi:hypothetical protein